MLDTSILSCYNGGVVRCYGDEAFEHYEDFRRNGWTELIDETYEEEGEDSEYVVMISVTVAQLDD